MYYANKHKTQNTITLLVTQLRAGVFVVVNLGVCANTGVSASPCNEKYDFTEVGFEVNLVRTQEERALTVSCLDSF